MPLDFPPNTPVDLFGYRGSNVFAFLSINFAIIKQSFHPLFYDFFSVPARSLLSFHPRPYALVKGCLFIPRSTKQLISAKLSVPCPKHCDISRFIADFQDKILHLIGCAAPVPCKCSKK